MLSTSIISFTVSTTHINEYLALVIQTIFFIRAAIWVVLFPGDAHISSTISFWAGCNVFTHIIEGKFCKRADPCGKKSSPKTGQPDTFSSVFTAMPLKIERE